MASQSSLPASDSSTLHLTHPNESEKIETWTINGKSWRGALSLPAYLRREEHLANQPLTLNGGITYWILVDSSASFNSSSSPSPSTSADSTSTNFTSEQRIILASCETICRRALIATRGKEVEEVVSHGVGSVFCREDFRGRGYAGRMMKELGKHLERWDQDKGNTTRFTVLYSDIGKKFYAKNGWKPFPSSHISLPPIPETSRPTPCLKELPISAPLRASDLTPLCLLDETLLRKQIVNFPPAFGPSIRAAIIPDVAIMQWHHAREEFTARETLGRDPEVKGAIISLGPGDKNKVWAIWTRTFGDEASKNKLHILRIVIEGEYEFAASSEHSPHGPRTWDERTIQATASILLTAQKEAARWNLQTVEVWNPSPLIVRAARELVPRAEVVHREEDSIASLMWYGDGEADEGKRKEEVEWVGNEKYAWC
ncbi:MAG: hypothetical protein Q9187_007469 [Circinaria calcarea]